jgi:hypothetical protein
VECGVGGHAHPAVARAFMETLTRYTRFLQVINKLVI